jgi:hypothetical protein
VGERQTQGASLGHLPRARSSDPPFPPADRAIIDGWPGTDALLGAYRRIALIT